MKKGFIALIFILNTLSIYGQVSETVSLDEAINNSTLQIQNSLDKGSTIIVYQFQSSNEKISDYILKELFNLLVNSYKFIVLDRTAQNVINAELDFQYSTSAGMMSDESLANLTKRIGAQAIITGSLDDTASEYRFRVRVIGTETTAAIFSYAVSVNRNDKRITAFTSRSTGEKLGSGALNILLGLGSYLEGDISGGITISAGYAVAVGLLVVEATLIDWDNPAIGIPATIGVCVAGVTVVYGFARPFIYNRSSKIALLMDNTQINFVQASGTDNAMAIQLSYSIKF